MLRRERWELFEGTFGFRPFTSGGKGDMGRGGGLKRISLLGPDFLCCLVAQ